MPFLCIESSGRCPGHELCDLAVLQWLADPDGVDLSTAAEAAGSRCSAPARAHPLVLSALPFMSAPVVVRRQTGATIDYQDSSGP